MQWVEEVRVDPGTTLNVTAKHDTYGISYSLADNDEDELAQRSTGVPLKVGGDVQPLKAGAGCPAARAGLGPCREAIVALFCMQAAGTGCHTRASSPAHLEAACRSALHPSNQRAPTSSARPPPPQDPAWEASHASLQELNSQLVKACVQNPLEYRSVAEAAVQFAARPHDLGLDAQQAVDFCVRMMG